MSEEEISAEYERLFAVYEPSGISCFYKLTAEYTGPYDINTSL
jgi:hypothetical protein